MTCDIVSLSCDTGQPVWQNSEDLWNKANPQSGGSWDLQLLLCELEEALRQGGGFRRAIFLKPGPRLAGSHTLENGLSP